MQEEKAKGEKLMKWYNETEDTCLKAGKETNILKPGKGRNVKIIFSRTEILTRHLNNDGHTPRPVHKHAIIIDRN